MSGPQKIITTGAVVGAMAMAEVTVGAKTGAAIGFVGGPAGAVAGAAVGAVAGAACYGITRGVMWMFRSSSSGGRTSGTPTSESRPIRKTSVRYQQDQLQGTSGQVATGGSGQDPNWWKQIHENNECLSPLEIFQRIVQEIRNRWAGASSSERLSLLKKLVEAFGNLLRSHPDLVVSIEERTRNLILDVPNGDAIELTADLVDLLGVFGEEAFDLGAASDSQTCIYRIRCRDCGTNYVGQTVDRTQRVRNHRKDMKAKDKTKSLYQHHKKSCCVVGCDHNFEDSYIFVVLMAFMEGIVYNNGLRAAEVFWQWLMKALKDDGGSGKK